MYEQNSVYDAMGTPLNNKYNQKELQETGFYDYGWRQYMPDLGRWFGMDQLSEKYHMTSPYAYAVNNPVMFYDIDGRDLPGWLQKLWDKTQDNQVTTFGGFDSNGNAGWSKKGGSFNTEQFTSFVTFLQGGGTGNYTFWTNGSGSDNVSYGNGAYNGDIQGVIGYNINITDDKAGAWRGEQARSRLHAAMGDNIADDLQGMLDGIGTIPILGEVADGFNAFISYQRGKRAQAALSFGAMVPFLGWGATAMKYSDKIIEINKMTEGAGMLLNGTPSSAINSAMYYEKVSEQGASIFKSISAGHMFIDGNKRTAVGVFQDFAKQAGLETVSHQQMMNVANQVATGQITDISQIARMLTK